VALAAGVAVLGILDQVPRGATASQRQEIAANVESDRQFGRAVEAALPPGAMLFQLPVMGFPEVVPPWRLADYEHFRPYLHTHDLRFSYGAAKHRARSRWQRDLEEVAPRVLVRRLEQYGFAALYLNRKGFEDGAEALLGELRRLGYEEIIQSPRGQQVMVRLRPAAAPQLPLARAFTFGQGWHPPADSGLRWAFAPAVLSYYNPFDGPITLEVKFTLETIAPGEITFAHEGATIGRVRAEGRHALLHLPALVLAPGVNRFRLESDQPAERRGAGRYQLRSFGLSGVSLRVRQTPRASAQTGD
jgi:phosphoglycerol transferase